MRHGHTGRAPFDGSSRAAYCSQSREGCLGTPAKKKACLIMRKCLKATLTQLAPEQQGLADYIYSPCSHRERT